MEYCKSYIFFFLFLSYFCKLYTILTISKYYFVKTASISGRGVDNTFWVQQVFCLYQSSVLGFGFRQWVGWIALHRERWVVCGGLGWWVQCCLYWLVVDCVRANSGLMGFSISRAVCNSCGGKQACFQVGMWIESLPSKGYLLFFSPSHISHVNMCLFTSHFVGVTLHVH